MVKKEIYNIRVLERAIRILDLLAEEEPLKLSQLSDMLNISSSTTFRILETLAEYRYVLRDEQKKGYRLGIRCLELANAYYATDDIRKIALPDLEWLRDETGETVHLGILDNMEVVYLEKLQGLHAVGIMYSRIGRRSPSYCTGLGKALIAYEDPEIVRNHFEHTGLRAFTPKTIRTVDEILQQLEKIRIKGYALDLGEHEPEVQCVSAPILYGRGKAIAAISISGPASRMEPLEENLRLINCTLDAAQKISKKLKNRILEGNVISE
jgi:IclR family transcriptional regulator, KDG regulon repressor